MKLTRGMTAILMSAVLTLPLAAHADRDKGQGKGAENCYEYKGRLKCDDDDARRPGKPGKANKQGKHEKAMKGPGKGPARTAGGPPPWAPAHGWRRKAGGYDDYFVDERTGAHVVVSGGEATVDVGIDKGTCNRSTIGAVVGGVIGGVIGNKVGDAENRKITTIAGVVIGGVVGHSIGRHMDKADQHCTGQALEQAKDNQTVRWADKSGAGEYSVTPKSTFESDGMDCREYVTEYKTKDGIKRERSTACRNTDGAWSKATM